MTVGVFRHLGCRRRPGTVRVTWQSTAAASRRICANNLAVEWPHAGEADPLASHGSRWPVVETPVGEELEAAGPVHVEAVPAAKYCIDYSDFTVWVLRGAAGPLGRRVRPDGLGTGRGLRGSHGRSTGAHRGRRRAPQRRPLPALRAEMARVLGQLPRHGIGHLHGCRPLQLGLKGRHAARQRPTPGGIRAAAWGLWTNCARRLPSNSCGEPGKPESGSPGDARPSTNRPCAAAEYPRTEPLDRGPTADQP